LHAAALLVDQYRRAGAADDGAEVAHERTHLVGSFDVAPEQDQPERIDLLEQFSLLGAEARTGTAENAGARHGQRVELHRRRVKRSAAFLDRETRSAQLRWITHSPPAALRLWQTSLACAREAKGPTWAR
jgi:hypothetical protein